MPTFPRTIKPISGSTEPQFAHAFTESVSHSGRRQSRTIDSGGVSWREEYPPLNFKLANDRDLKATINYYLHRQVTFDIQHLAAAGSGIVPLGLGTAGILVKGATQSGDSILTDQWPVSTNNVVVAGDWIAIAGSNYRYQIRANANSDGAGEATLSLVNPIFVGSSPADNAAVTTTGVNFQVQLVDASNLANITRGFYYGGVFAVFMEMP